MVLALGILILCWWLVLLEAKVGHDSHLTVANNVMIILLCAQQSICFWWEKFLVKKKDGSELEVVEDSEASRQRLDVLVLQF